MLQKHHSSSLSGLVFAYNTVGFIKKQCPAENFILICFISDAEVKEMCLWEDLDIGLCEFLLFLWFLNDSAVFQQIKLHQVQGR